MKTAIVFLLVLTLVVAPIEAFARGGRGGRGGRAVGGGGGGRPGGGFQGGGFQGAGGGMAHPTAHAPTFSRPSAPAGGSFQGVSRPSGGGFPNAGSRPGGGFPNAGSHPAAGNLPNAGIRPGASGFPNAGSRPAGGTLPNAGIRPGGGNLPNAGPRPGGGEFPNAGTRSGGGGFPSAGPRPGAGNPLNPGIRPGGGNFPDAGIRPGGGNFPKSGNRPEFNNRPNAGNDFANRSNFNNRIGDNNFGRNNFGNNVNINNNRPFYGNGNHPNYGNWYHGNWHGNWGQPWGYRPYGWGYGSGWGYGAWGFGAGLATAGLIGLASPWNWGYYGYSNPYYSAPAGGAMGYADYSQPMISSAPMMSAALVDDGQQLVADAPPPDAAADPSAGQEQGLALFDNARALFEQGEYQAALAETDKAAPLMPNDPVLHEFRALCLFAVGDYQQAAGALYSVLSAGPGWDWTTVSSLYPDIDTYTQQLRALENYRKQNPRAADARFVLAYQYLLQGHQEQAANELKAVVALQPDDQLSAQLLKGLTTPVGESPTDTKPAVPAQPVNAEAIAGDWKATRADGAKFGLRLSADDKFTWVYSQQDKTQEFSGTYTLADNYLILKASDQNALVGQVALQSNKRLNFKLSGDNPADPGLEFSK